MTTWLVRAMERCPSITYPAPNTQTSAGTPGCAPGVPYSPYTFEDGGSCLVKTKTKREDPCSNGTGIPCTDIAIKVKCSGILDPGGVPIDDLAAAGWSVGYLSRITVDDDGTAAGFGPGTGDQTIIDFPANFGLPAGKKGKLNGIVGTNSGFCLFLSPCPPKPPECMNIEQIALRLLDPQGRVFAVPGSSTR